MAEQTQKSGGGGKGKGRKVGREKRHPSHVNYKANHRREKNKLKRIAQSNGFKAAREYAVKNGLHFKGV